MWLSDNKLVNFSHYREAAFTHKLKPTINDRVEFNSYAALLSIDYVVTAYSIRFLIPTSYLFLFILSLVLRDGFLSIMWAIWKMYIAFTGYEFQI